MNNQVSLFRTICGQPIEFRTHKKPDLDEIWALRLIETRATPAWLAEHAPNGVIELGINGGEFDEHVGDRKQYECCATLVARSLGLGNAPEFEQIQEFLFRVDSCGKGHPFDLFWMAKLLNRKYPNDPELAIAKLTEFMELKEDQQRDFVGAIQQLEEATQGGQYREVMHGNGRTYLIVYLESDNEYVMSAAVKIFRTALLALVQKNSRGQIQIFPNNGDAAQAQRGKIRLNEVVARLRMAELRVQRKQIPLDPEQAQSPGCLTDLVPEWYYFPTGEQVLNGCLTHPDTPATQISLSEVVDRVKYGIETSLACNNAHQLTKV